MFVLLRVALAAALFVFLTVLICRSEGRKFGRIVLVLLLCAALAIGLSFARVETVLFSFPSAEASYHYSNLLEPAASCVVEGHACDLVVCAEGDPQKATFWAVPKTEKGWQLGGSWDLEAIPVKRHGDVRINVYRHVPSGDVFVAVHTRSGQPVELSDSKNSTFLTLNGSTASTDYVSYYTYVPDYEKGYRVVVNGDTVPLI